MIFISSFSQPLVSLNIKCVCSSPFLFDFINKIRMSAIFLSCVSTVQMRFLRPSMDFQSPPAFSFTS